MQKDKVLGTVSRVKLPEVKGGEGAGRAQVHVYKKR